MKSKTKNESSNIAAIGGLIFLALILAAAAGSAAGSVAEDQLLFISSDDCQVCDSLRPFAMESSELLGVQFVEGKFSRVVPFPGYVLLLNGEVNIAGFNSEAILFQSLCDLTQNAAVCQRYGQVTPVDDQTAG